MYDEILKELKTNLSFTYGEQITNFDSGYVGDVFSEIADSNVDIYTSDLFEWGKSNLYYIDEATKELGDPHDILRQLQQGQYYAYEQELYENKDDVIRYFAYSYLNDSEIKISEEQEEDLEDYLSDIDSNSKLEDIIDFCRNFDKGYDVA